jgi:DNA-binding response OmpR family regulator
MVQASIHPLAPQVGIDLSRVPFNRPRFTTSEAVLLNTLVNADGKVVTVVELARVLKVMQSSVYSYIGSLRAKLGEPAYQPRLILTDHPNEDNDRVTGWRFAG